MFFKSDSKRLCVDATIEDGTYGRLINHSAVEANLKIKVMKVENDLRVVFCASRRIESGEELLYDYGDRRKEAVEGNPWLQS